MSMTLGRLHGVRNTVVKDYMINYPHLFTSNEIVDDHNSQMLNTLGQVDTVNEGIG